MANRRAVRTKCEDLKERLAFAVLVFFASISSSAKSNKCPVSAQKCSNLRVLFKNTNYCGYTD